MASRLNPYLHFGGDARQALEFYQEVFGGELVLNTYGSFGQAERANRPTRDHFRCRRCGLAGPADVVAGVNVRDRARSVWAFVTMPVPQPV
jgi:hypothetical protein